MKKHGLKSFKPFLVPSIVNLKYFCFQSIWHSLLQSVTWL